MMYYYSLFFQMKIYGRNSNENLMPKMKYPSVDIMTTIMEENFQ